MKTSQKTISVIVPVYNQSRYLSICLDAIWFQDYPAIEIIVVNDGSTDSTSDTLKAYEEALLSDRTSYACNYDETAGRVDRCEHLRYPAGGRRFQVVHHAENKGLGAALNTGFRMAAGDYCTFIASDDMLLPSAVSDLASFLDQGYDFAYADMHIVDDIGRVLRRFSLPDYSFEDTFCRWYLCGVCKLYRRQLHERFGYYDERIKPQDHDMYLRFATGGARFVHLPKVLANVRFHDGERQVDNHSPDNWNRLYEESAALVLKARQWLGTRG